MKKSLLIFYAFPFAVIAFLRAALLNALYLILIKSQNKIINSNHFTTPEKKYGKDLFQNIDC